MKAFFILTIAVAIATTAKAQNYKLDRPFLATKSIRVNGVCDMCKHRIENAVKKGPGVSTATWNVDSKTLLVQYFRTKTNPAQIQTLVAAAGHDTEGARYFLPSKTKK